MNTISVPIDAENSSLDLLIRRRSVNRLNLWAEVRKYSLLLGVLVAIILAVISPRFGSSGGPLYTQYLSHIPSAYILYSAGRTTAAAAVTPSAVASTLLAAIVSPSVVALMNYVGLVDAMTAKGLIITSLSPPAAWLPLAMSSRDHKLLSQSSSLVAVATVVSLATSPAVFYVVCQTQAPPPLYPTLLNIVTLVFPYRIGAKLRAKFNSETNLTSPDTSDLESQSSWRKLMDLTFVKSEMMPRGGVLKICALALVYVECSTQLYDAEGGLYISHVMAAFFGVLLYLTTSWWVATASSRLFGEDRVNSAVFVMLAKGFSVGVVCS